MSKVIIDVRERDEYASEHIEHSINVPLSSFSVTAPGVLKAVEDREILFICHSGMRSSQAVGLAKAMGYQNEHTYDTFEGGLLEWKKQGNPVISDIQKSVMPINRQVQITAGGLTAIFGMLGGLDGSTWSYLAAAMGAGLFVSGVSGTCAMAHMLNLMPWNKTTK